MFKIIYLVWLPDASPVKRRAGGLEPELTKRGLSIGHSQVFHNLNRRSLV